MTLIGTILDVSSLELQMCLHCYCISYRFSCYTESITYTLDEITPTVVLYDDDSDNVVTSIDSLIVTATFSESVQLTPTIYLGSVVTNAQMSPTSSQDNWTYFFD